MAGPERPGVLATQLNCAARANIAWLVDLQTEYAPCSRPAPAQRLLERARADRQDRVRAVGEEAQERLGAGLLAVLTAVCCILNAQSILHAQSKPATSRARPTVQRPKARR